MLQFIRCDHSRLRLIHENPHLRLIELLAKCHLRWARRLVGDPVLNARDIPETIPPLRPFGHFLVTNDEAGGKERTLVPAVKAGLEAALVGSAQSVTLVGRLDAV
jgi:hypothetical protein